MRKQIFLDIQSIVLSLHDTSGASIIRHFDLYNQQLQYLASSQPFDCPAVFVEFLPLAWQTLSRTTQECDFSFRLHIVSRWLGNTHSTAPASTQLSELAFLDLPEQLFSLFQHKRLTSCGSITRVSTDFDSNHETYIQTIETYLTRFRDTTDK
jgi:hypothetical protein